MNENKRKTIFGNLDRLDCERVKICEKQIAHLGELAEFLCDEAGEDEIFFRDEAFREKYLELTGLRPSAGNKTAAEVFSARVGFTEKVLSGLERIYLCRRITDTLGISGFESAGTFFDEPTEDIGGLVSYMKGSYADTAFSRFSEVLEDPKVLYGHDFSEVCENVYYGRAPLCILPVENSDDGRLAGFRGLIMKYGLKTVMTCRVITSEEGDFTIFALLRKNVTVSGGGASRYFEFRVKTEKSPAEFLTAADACGMKTVMINSVPETGNTGTCYDVVLKTDGAGLCGFLSYMILEYPDFVTSGIYGEI